MAQFYKILKADPLGEPYTPNVPNAKAIQSYWCQVEGEEWNVMISKQVGNTLTPGEHVYGDLTKATSQKGNNYWKFKSQMVPEGVQRPASTPAQSTAQAAVGTTPVDTSGTVPGWASVVINEQGEIKAMLEHVVTMLETLVEQRPVALAPEIAPPDPDTKARLDAIFSPDEDVAPLEDVSTEE